MVLTEDQNEAHYQIKAYDQNTITINEQTYNQSIVVSPNQLILDWPPQSLADLQPQHWQAILLLKPEIILLGTGRIFRMPEHSLLADIYAARIGIESMDTAAACRTYIALSSENRRVVAALLIQ